MRSCAPLTVSCRQMQATPEKEVIQQGLGGGGSYVLFYSHFHFMNCSEAGWPDQVILSGDRTLISMQVIAEVLLLSFVERPSTSLTHPVAGATLEVSPIESL